MGLRWWQALLPRGRRNKMGHTSGGRQLSALETALANVLFYERRETELIEELGTNHANLVQARDNLVIVRAETEAVAKRLPDGSSGLVTV